MLVDDNAQILTVLSAFARHFTDATIECHVSPKEALMAYAAAPESYELVITDFEMPGMDGVELCRRLHSVSAVQKVILTTGSGCFSDAAARHYGFSALLTKPVPLVALSDVIEALGLKCDSDCPV